MARLGSPGNADNWVPMLTVGPFGGIDPTTEPYYVSTSNFVDMLNILPNKGYGGFVTADGRKVFLSEPLPGQCKGIYKFARPGHPNGYIFAVDIGEFSGNGALYYAEAGGAPQLLTLPAGASLTYGQKYSLATAQQWCFVTNGVDTPLKIDQELNVTYWGIVAPTTAPVLIAAGTSTMSGTYYYCITFGNTVQESSQGVVSAPITVSGTGVGLTAIPTSSDPQVTQRNIYRLGGSNGIWSLVGTINDNTTTTYTDTTADTAVGHSLTVFRDPPPAFKYILSYNQALFGFGTPSDDSIVWFSNFNEPWGFNSETGNLPVGEGSPNDVAMGMSITGSVLALNKSNTLYAVYGNSASSYAVSFIEYTGCVAPRSVGSAYGISFWLSMQGVRIWTGAAASQNISDGTFQTTNIKAILDNLSFSDMQQAVCFVYDRMLVVSFPTIEVSYVYDLRTSAWYPIGWATDVAFFDLNGQYPVIAQNLFATGEIDQWFAAPGDFGNPINAYIESGIADSGAINAEKTYRYVQVEAPPQDATLSIQTTINPGSNQYMDTQALDMSKGGPVFQISLPKPLKGRQVQLKVLVTSNQRIHVQKAVVLGQIARFNIQQDT